MGVERYIARDELAFGQVGPYRDSIRMARRIQY